MAKTRRGLFIAIEGGDGAGKTTQAKLLAQRLRAHGHPCVLTREPAGTDLGRFVKQLLEDSSVALDPLAELLLFQAARAQHVAEVILPALQRGDIIVCDRFVDSSLAYQGHGRGLDLALIRRLNDAASGGLRPDLTILLDLPSEVGLARADARPRTGARLGPSGRQEHEKSDLIGAESLAFHQRVREGYRALATENQGRFLIIDATLPPEQVAQRIWEHLQPLLTSR